MNNMKKIQVFRKYEIVAHELRRLMLEGYFKVGTLLPNEKDLSEQLGVGRSTVREALKLLEAWGLINANGQRGQSEVIGVPLAGFFNSLEMVMQFAEISILEATEIRLVLEPYAAYCAAKSITKEKIQFIESYLKSEENLRPEFDGHSTNNFYLHLAIAKASDKKLLAVFIEALKSVIEQVDKELITTEELRKKMHRQHIQLVKCISQGQAEEARQVIYEHISFALETMRERAATTFIRPVNINSNSPNLDGML